MLGDQERDPGHAAQDEERHDPVRRVAGLLALDHRERQTGQERRAEDEPDYVEAPALAVRGLWHGYRSQHERHNTESEVEPEDRSPAGEPHEHAADHRAEGESETRDRRPDPESISTRFPVGVHVTDDRQSPGLAGRGADTHDHARGDEPIDVAGERSNDRSNAENCDTGEHDPLAAE